MWIWEATQAAHTGGLSPTKRRPTDGQEEPGVKSRLLAHRNKVLPFTRKLCLLPERFLTCCPVVAFHLLSHHRQEIREPQTLWQNWLLPVTQHLSVSICTMGVNFLMIA